MMLLKKIKNKNVTKYKFGCITLYKKEKLLSSKRHFLFGVNYYKKKIKPDIKEYYLFNIKIYSKKIDIITNLLKYANNTDFIYYCFHNGEFYVLCSLIKNNFERFKNIKILTNFSYLRGVLELFEFDKQWIDEHFVVVPFFYPSLALWCNSKGKIVNHLHIDHEKGWIFNGRIQKKHGKYIPFTESIAKFCNVNGFLNVSPTSITPESKEKTVLLIPESQFNGNLDFDFVLNLSKDLQDYGYKILINTKTNVYDELLNDNVSKIFVSIKDTYQIALKCCAVIAVRSGLSDCLQTVAGGAKFFVIYNRKKYLHYKYFKDFYKWFKEAYSFNRINDTQIYNEYFYEEDYKVLKNKIIKILVKE